MKRSNFEGALAGQILAALFAMLISVLAPGQAQNEDGATTGREATPKAPNTQAFVPPDGYEVTPAGYFHESCVRTIANGDRLLVDGRVQHANSTTDDAAAVCNYPRYTPAGILIGPTATTKDTQLANFGKATAPEISGWLEATSDYTGSPTSSYGALTAMWTVPPQPASDDGQTLYFFPGFEDANGAVNGVFTILQPVLGWTGGQYLIASWNCCISGVISKSPNVNVSPGDQIYGSITSTCTAGTLSCPTWNVLTLDMTTGFSTIFADTPTDGQIFNWAFGAVFEPYYIVSCNDYPPNGHLTFDNITVFSQHLAPLNTSKWTKTVEPHGSPACNYSVVQVTGHEITLKY